jgi:predicted Zn-dependent protease
MAQVTTDQAAVAPMNSAEQLMRAGKTGEAVAAFEKILKQYKLDAKDESFVRGCLGYLYKDDPRALPMLQRAHELDTTNVFVLLPLASLYMVREENDKAVGLFQAFLALKPDSSNAPQARRLLLKAQGLSALQRGKFVESIELLKKAIAQKPDDDDSVQELAVAYEGANQLKSAVATWRQYAQMQILADRVAYGKARANKLERLMPLDDPLADNYVKAISSNHLVIWPRVSMPLRVFIESGAGIPGYQSYYHASVTEALDEWSKATNGKFLWKTVEDKSKAHIVIRWANTTKDFLDKDADPEGECVTESMYEVGAPNGWITHVTITYLTVGDGKPIPKSTFDRIALHEVGHGLGLRGHSTNSQDVLYFCEQPQMAGKKLSPRDTATIKIIYEMDQSK